MTHSIDKAFIKGHEEAIKYGAEKGLLPGTVKIKIWCLFSIANEYNQPLNNLEAWWLSKPTFDQLAKTIGVRVDKKKGNKDIGTIFKGKEARIGGCDYRLKEIKEGKL